MNINLHIERLVLEGLPVEAHHAARVKAAVEAELTRLLTENGLSSKLQNDVALTRLQAETIQLSAEPTPLHLGRQIAQTVHGQIGPEISTK